MRAKLTVKTVAAAIIAACCSIPASAQQEIKSPEEMASEEATRLESLLSLEPHQTFFIDSVLAHDTKMMYEEMKALQKDGVMEETVYRQIRDKWTESINRAYREILTDTQWIAFLKSQGKFKEARKAAKSLKEKE
ncbi:MAG TPA: hypothetical protein IAC34_03205 [Candidatus Coprenecus stercoripullorum]|nr:hypothetical protein [Candidatus Coprenecus stercoripullorum]